MDWPNDSIEHVMAEFRAIGQIPIHPYSAGIEYHHINLAKAPKVEWPFLPLKPGSKGLWVYVLTGRLRNCGYHRDGIGKGPILPRTGKFTVQVEAAVRRFQGDHRLPVDGVVGVHTWANLKAAERAAKKTKKGKG
jgi:peptidoglycan hydrolase-like protein with peptidoglycan-binding domain